MLSDNTYEPHSMRLGGILFNHGFVTREELEKALAEQDRSETKLGKILLGKGYIHEKDLAFGLKIQSILLAMGLATALTCIQTLEGNPAFAGKRGSDISVKAVVPIRSQLTILFQPPSLTLTDADIDRGYVEIRGATRVSIKNNNKEGYILLFEGLGRPFKEVLISGFPRDIQINSSGAFVYQAFTKNAVAAELSYRFVLFEDARAGEYTWPISLSLQPAP